MHTYKYRAGQSGVAVAAGRAWRVAGDRDAQEGRRRIMAASSLPAVVPARATAARQPLISLYRI